jgi:DNA-binding transcriptional ArsR family regulator
MGWQGMSYNATDWAFKQPIEDSGAKLVLLAIAHHADNKGEAFPSYARINELTGIAKRTITRKISLLVELGLLHAEERTRPNGSRTSTLYRVDIKSGVAHVPNRQGASAKMAAPPSQNGSTLINQHNKSLNHLSIQAEPDETEDKIDWADLASSVM